eukprot:scaffold43913_cov33-Tisochrysis_lutea.AAC.1
MKDVAARPPSPACALLASMGLVTYGKYEQDHHHWKDEDQWIAAAIDTERLGAEQHASGLKEGPHSLRTHPGGLDNVDSRLVVDHR